MASLPMISRQVARCSETLASNSTLIASNFHADRVTHTWHLERPTDGI